MECLSYTEKYRLYSAVNLAVLCVLVGNTYDIMLHPTSFGDIQYKSYKDINNYVVKIL